MHMYFQDILSTILSMQHLGQKKSYDIRSENIGEPPRNTYEDAE